MLLSNRIARKKMKFIKRHNCSENMTFHKTTWWRISPHVSLDYKILQNIQDFHNYFKNLNSSQTQWFYLLYFLKQVQNVLKNLQQITPSTLILLHIWILFFCGDFDFTCLDFDVLCVILYLDFDYVWILVFHVDFNVVLCLIFDYLCLNFDCLYSNFTFSLWTLFSFGFLTFLV